MLSPDRRQRDRDGRGGVLLRTSREECLSRRGAGAKRHSEQGGSRKLGEYRETALTPYETGAGSAAEIPLRRLAPSLKLWMARDGDKGTGLSARGLGG